MKTILITNDDGIQADGIIRLARAAAKYGKVFVVAPDGQRSAMSHSINLREPIYVRPHDMGIEGVEAWKISGTPADCVRLAVPNIIKYKPDVVLSGINYGNNSGTDIQYSATVGAAMEAALMGIHAIAVSESCNGNHQLTDIYLDQILTDLIDRKLPHNQIWNVNFPACDKEHFKGILEDRRVALNSFYDDRYVEELLPDGTRCLRVDGHYQECAAEGTDFRALVDGYISIGVVNNLH